MNELFKLFGRLIIDTEEANKDMDETMDNAEKSESKLSSIFGKIGNGLQKAAKAGAVVIATTATLATTALVSLTTHAVKSYADYEQLVGGVETLFGAGGQSIEEYAASVGETVDEVSDKYNDLMAAQDAVLRHADKAYETAGLSANAYMETVTSFSAALISSLNGDTVKAAEVADKAIVDMSDNANKMGSSMESIQNAYQGFAKQNYTMLDNLKLGYGGTKEEMQRLLEDAGKLANQKFDLSSYADIVEAIHVVQENMGIAGTTAKEASTTIQGSIGMLKASWTNFVTGLADENADLSTLMDGVVDSFAVVVENIGPRIIEVLPKIVGAVEYIIGGIAGYLPGLLDKLLPPLISGVISLVSGLLPMIPSILGSLLPILVDALGSIFEQLSASTGLDFSGLFDSIIEGASQMGEVLLEVLPNILSGIQTLIPPLLQITQSILPLIFTLLQAVIPIIRSLVSVLSPVITILSEVISHIADMLVPVIQNLCDFIATAIIPAIEGWMSMIESAIGWVVSFIQDNMNIVQGIFQSTFDVISGIIQFFTAFFQGDWSGMWQAVQNILQAGWNFIVNIFNLIKSLITNILSDIWSVVSGKLESIKTAFTTKLSAVVSTVASKFQEIQDKINEKIEAAKDIVRNGVEKLKEFFKFEWELPKIKLPHFKLSGKFSLDPPSVPSFGVEWYKKGAVLTDPTIFGVNPVSGKAMVGGEAGDEAIAPIETLQHYVREAVADQNKDIIVILNAILKVIGSIDENLAETLYDALLGLQFKINDREFARLVKAVN